MLGTDSLYELEADGKQQCQEVLTRDLIFFFLIVSYFNILLARRILKRAEHEGIIHTDLFLPFGTTKASSFAKNSGRILGTKMYTTLDFSWSCFLK